MLLQARGLRETIKRGAWRQKIKEKQLFIEEILPYAVALNVINDLANDLDDLGIEPPDYVAAAGSVTGLSTSQLVTDFTQQSISTLSYNPNSKSSSSGSGFSGGSSGGGGGGGGGGSW